ncbi:MAG: ankyrin repeat domain-containing protein [Sulfurovum sp.]|nr:ankyrin repeat domain-containing protein [Sulfurovum sp.]NNJ46043.1 ankyrin repeat domain-containing protein [Sulfurovum sp.]
MTPSYLHENLMQACENGNFDEVKRWLDQGADVNLNIHLPKNALDTAVQTGNHEIINLLLEHDATIKEYVLQKAIEKEKKYLHLLIPNIEACKDEKLLTGMLLAAINTGDLDLAKQAIKQGAKSASLFVYAILTIASVEILQLLIENGFNIHADTNKILTKWMGSSPINSHGEKSTKRHDLLQFIIEYYLERPNSIEGFKSWNQSDKSRLFRMGLDTNNLNIMKFSVLIGVNKNESLNSVLNQYYSKTQDTNTQSTILEKHENVNVDSEIIEYILNSNIIFTKVIIANAVCFNYTKILNVLSHMDDLEYAYEIAYSYENDALQKYFINKGVSIQAQHFTQMKVSATKGNLKDLRQAVNNGAKLDVLGTDVIVEIINENHVKILKYFHASGIVFDRSYNKHLNKAMNAHHAYESINYLIELGLDITSIGNLPLDYRAKYPSFSHMWEKKCRNIFNYTIYLATEVYPKREGKIKEDVLKEIAEFSTLPYVIKMSEAASLEQ